VEGLWAGLVGRAYGKGENPLLDNRTYVRLRWVAPQEDNLKQATDELADLQADELPNPLADELADELERSREIASLRSLIGPSVVEPQAGLFDVSSLWGPGQLLGLVGAPGLGMTQVGIAQLAAISGPLAWVESNQWFSPEAAWEGGISDKRMVVVRSRDQAGWAEATAALMDGMAAVCAEVPSRLHDNVLRRLAARARARRARLILRSRDQAGWAEATAALMDGMAAVCAEVPSRLHDNVLRRLAARARARRARLILRSRGPLPTGIAHSVITAEAVEWVGAGQGRGRLLHRRVVATAKGKGVKGPAVKLGFEDDGTNFVCVVSGLGAAASRRATG